MHHIIRIIVKAKNEEDALLRAKGIFDEAFPEGNHHGIDYGTFFDERHTSVSGAGRWGPHKAAVKLLSKEGAEWLLGGLHITYTDFKAAIQKIRGFINKSDLEIFNLHFMDKYYFRKAYDKDWIFYDYEFMDVKNFNMIFCSENLNDYYIVPVDVHT